MVFASVNELVKIFLSFQEFQVKFYFQCSLLSCWFHLHILTMRLMLVPRLYPECPSGSALIGLVCRWSSVRVPWMQQALWIVDRICACDTCGSGVLPSVGLGVTSSQLNLPSLTPLPVELCGRRQLGAQIGLLHYSITANPTNCGCRFSTGRLYFTITCQNLHLYCYLIATRLICVACSQYS